MVKHEYINGTCKQCGCKPWEGSKPCKRVCKSTPHRERESESSKHCDAGYMNDTRFGY